MSKKVQGEVWWTAHEIVKPPKDQIGKGTISVVIGDSGDEIEITTIDPYSEQFKGKLPGTHGHFTGPLDPSTPNGAKVEMEVTFIKNPSNDEWILLGDWHEDYPGVGKIDWTVWARDLRSVPT